MLASGRMLDEQIRKLGRALAGAFDQYVCTNWESRTRPHPDTVPGLLRDGLLAGGAAGDAVVCIAGQEAALRYVLDAAGPGDVIAVNTAEPDKAMAVIERFTADRAGAQPGRIPAP